MMTNDIEIWKERFIAETRTIGGVQCFSYEIVAEIMGVPIAQVDWICRHRIAKDFPAELPVEGWMSVSAFGRIALERAEIMMIGIKEYEAKIHAAMAIVKARASARAEME